MTDEELRDRLAAWAKPIRTAPAPELRFVRDRARRRVRRRAVTAAAAVVLVAVAAILAAPRLIGGSGQPPATRHEHGSWFPAGPLPGPDAGPASAPFFVVLDQARPGAPALVYRVSRQHPQPRRIAVISPGPGLTYIDVLAAGDDRTFVLAAAGGGSQGPVTKLLEFRLSDDGRPGRLHQLGIRLGMRLAGVAGDMALTADATELAVAGHAGDNAVIQVASLASGALRTWTAGAGAVGSLSWAGDAALAFTWSAQGAPGPAIFALSTTSGGGGMAGSDRLLVPARTRFGKFRGPAFAQVTATSTAVFSLMTYPLAPPNGPGTELGIVQFAARTGRPLRVVSQASESGMGSFCGVLWADRSGRQLLTSCGYAAGSIRDGRFTPWVPAGHQPFWYSLRDVPFAW